MFLLRLMVCLGRGNACRAPSALLLLAALGLGVLPIAAGQPLTPAGDERACRFEPIDVCGAGDAAPGVLADLPTLLPAAVAVVVSATVLPFAQQGPAAPRAGFPPGVYRPPRPAC